MRKKSHISLACYLVQEMDSKDLLKHKKAFYLGSILPDLTPKMITSPHEFSTSFEDLKQRIRGLIFDAQIGMHCERVLWRRLGVVMHYLADYFTFPHNSTYEGNLKDHCLYERDMKHALRTYVRTEEAQQIFREQQMYLKKSTSLAELFREIEQTHHRYLSHRHSVPDDCRWIVEMCSRVLIGLVSIMFGEGVRTVSRSYPVQKKFSF